MRLPHHHVANESKVNDGDRERGWRTWKYSNFSQGGNTSGLHFDLTTCQIEIPEIGAPAGGRLQPDGALSGSGETDISFDGLPGDARTDLIKRVI